MEMERLGVDVRPIKNGWAALSGEGWAVHGASKDEAVRRYHRAIERHREIDTRSTRLAGRNGRPER